MSQKKFSAPVLVLSITCAVLVGIIGGYFGANMMLFWRFASFPMRSVVSNDSSEYEHSTRKDILFYNPGNDDLWNTNYKQILAGKGEIIGRVFIDGKPAQDLEFALILANGRKTQRATVDKEGKYKISIPIGKYFLNGLLIYNKSQEINDKFLINKISKEEGLSILIENTNNRSVQDDYLKLEKELGPEEAVKKLLKSFVASTPFRDKFPFEIGESPFMFPDIQYRSPISVLSPSNNAKISIDDLRFIWEPVEEAAYYKVTVTNIERKGTTTSYRNALSLSNIENNQIQYTELFKRLNVNVDKDDCDQVENLKENELYGFRVIAYNMDRQIITASSDSSTELTVFSVSKKP
ncbi:MAG: hypothetical protein SV686_03815 [Thermodesulfobacteriota bacterium]|nr:hypothetical protein [Thermodesulfobacteriota bacterium]